MYIVWIAWLYVVLMLAVGQATLLRSGMVLVLLGVLPSLLLVHLVRRRQRLKEMGFIEPKPRKKPRDDAGT